MSLSYGLYKSHFNTSSLHFVKRGRDAEFIFCDLALLISRTFLTTISFFKALAAIFFLLIAISRHH